MHINQVIAQIEKIPLLKGMEFHSVNETNSYSTLSVEPRHFKDANKNEIRLQGEYGLFIAHMYKDNSDMEEFFYLNFHHKGTQRYYRRRTWYGIEYNKIFVTGKSVAELISNFNEKLIGYTLK